MPRYALVILDLDGTLVDSAPDLCMALAATLAELGLPPHDLAAVRRMIGEGQRVLVERALQQAGGDPALVAEALPRFRAHYSRCLVEQTVPYAGVAESLPRLAQAVPLAVATNKPGTWARQIVMHLGLAPHLRWVLGEDDVGRRKPDPLLLLELCRRAGAPPSATLFVGDSLIDAQTAQAAGMDLAYCTWGYGQEGGGGATARFRLGAFPDLIPIVLEGPAPATLTEP